MGPGAVGCYVWVCSSVPIVQTAISTNILPLRSRIIRITRVIVGEVVAHGRLLIFRPRKDIAETSTRRVRNRGRGVVLVDSHLGVGTVARYVCADCGGADREDVGTVVPGCGGEDGGVAVGVVEAAVGVVVGAGVEGDAVVAGGEDGCCSCLRVSV
jgi:hypothetical protein